MKYQLEILKAYYSDTRECSNRECALNIFKRELKDALYINDNNCRGYFYKIYNNGARCLMYYFDTYYSNKIKKGGE